MTSTIKLIISFLKNGPASIQAIANHTKKDRRTVQSYLESLESSGLVKVRKGHAHIYSLHLPNNYFELPVKEEDQKIIITIYSYINKFSKKYCGHKASSLEAQKTLYVIAKKLKMKLPIGWYQYGPLCVQAYTDEESYPSTLTQKQVSVIKDVTKEYCAQDGISAMKKLYADEENELYLAKEDLLRLNTTEKEEVHAAFLKIIRLVPKETVDVVTDFARASLLVGWNNMQEHFPLLWKYVAAVIFKESLGYYPQEVKDFYLTTFIEKAKEDIQTIVYKIVKEKVRMPTRDKKQP